MFFLVGVQPSQPVGSSESSGSSEHEEQSNGFRKLDKDIKAVQEGLSTSGCDIQGTSKERTHSIGKEEGTGTLNFNVEESGFGQVSSSGEVDRENAADGLHNDLDFDLSSDSDSDSGKQESSHSEKKNSDTKTHKQTKLEEDDWVREGNGEGRIEIQETLEVNQGVLSAFGNDCADKKETETESQNSEQSGVTMGEESLDHSMGDEEEEPEEEDTDQDDHLIYLEEILVRIHNEYYLRYEAYLRQERLEMPDIRKIVPELKRRTLAGTTIVFSGLYPTNYPMERTREYYHAKALGAKIGKSLVLSDKDPERTTHVIAARAGKSFTLLNTCSSIISW